MRTVVSSSGKVTQHHYASLKWTIFETSYGHRMLTSSKSGRVILKCQIVVGVSASGWQLILILHGALDYYRNYIVNNISLGLSVRV